MSRTVFILGAGASKKAGGPLMDEFLDVARELRRAGKVKEYEEDFALVFEGLSHLQDTQAKFSLQFHNVESAFAAFEMAKIAGRMGTMPPEDVKRLPAAMKRLISRTIELTVVPHVSPNQTDPPAPYSQFVELLKAIHPGRPPGDRSCVITMNYDLAMDFALHNRMVVDINIDYCLGAERKSHGFKLIKLHGSLNWGFCAKCKKIAPWHPAEWLGDPGVDRRLREEGALAVASQIGTRKHECGNMLDPEPFIVPPTWNKTMHAAGLSSVWSAAARELMDAEEIIVIGYSLPETDSFFRYLLALGMAGRQLVDKFWVFDPDPKREVPKRFEDILGPAAKGRFLPFEQGFESMIQTIHLEPTPDAG